MATGLVHEDDIIDRFNHREEHALKIDEQIQELQSNIQDLRVPSQFAFENQFGRQLLCSKQANLMCHTLFWPAFLFAVLP